MPSKRFQQTGKIKKSMYPGGVHVHILCNVVPKHARAFHLKWLYWHYFFTVERYQASALLNVHVSLSFFLYGKLNMLH